MIDLLALLKTTGIEVAYNEFETKPTLPFICYRELTPDHFGADDRVYYKAKNYEVELCTQKKNSAHERQLESEFDSAGIFYEKSENFIREEKMMVVAYTFNLEGL